MKTVKLDKKQYLPSIADEEFIDNAVFFRTGIKPELWACAYIPILMIQKDMDTVKNIKVVTGTRRFTRAQLAAKLKLSVDLPFGVQLWKKGKLTAKQADYIDNHLFEGKSVRLKFAFNMQYQDVIQIFSDLRKAGLVTGPVLYYTAYEEFFAELSTTSFLSVIKAIAQRVDDAATLILIDGIPFSF